MVLQFQPPYPPCTLTYPLTRTVAEVAAAARSTDGQWARPFSPARRWGESDDLLDRDARDLGKQAVRSSTAKNDVS
jgi:hypothetical protein